MPYSRQNHSRPSSPLPSHEQPSLNEKATTSAHFPLDTKDERSCHAPSPVSIPPPYTPSSSQSSPLSTPYRHQSPPLQIPDHLRSSWCSQPITVLLRPWWPLILYLLTTAAFVVAIAFYREQVFAGLDELAQYLRADQQFGHALLFGLIFLTTIPPIPLYSTLTVLAGYTFGPWTGAVISYCAALSGALAVFIVSRTLLRDCISRWLSSTTTIRRVICAVERRPKLLFLIRLAPYPYNVMNCLLAASPSLTLRTYTMCTALSLFKIIIHTSMGASIHSFRDYHNVKATDNIDEESNANGVAQAWTVLGIALCIVIFIYLSIVARRAVDEELEDTECLQVDRDHMVSLNTSRRDLEAGTIPISPSSASSRSSSRVR